MGEMRDSREFGTNELPSKEQELSRLRAENERLTAGFADASASRAREGNLRIDLERQLADAAACALAAEARAEKAKKAAQDYCWERYKDRDPLNLATPAVFTSHEWQKIGEYIDAALASLPKESADV